MREFRIKVNNEKTYVVKANDYNQAVKKLHSKLNDDWSKGVSVTVKVTTESLINAAKEHKVLLGGRNDAPEKFIGRTSIRFTLPNKDNTAYANIDNSQSTIHYNMYDDEFTYKEFGGKKDFNKAKLTEGLKKLQDYVVSQLKSVGIVVNQSKVEVGGSSKFNSTWRQAQSYNDSSVKDYDLTNFLALKRSLELRIGEEIDFDKLEEYVNKLPKDKNGKKNIDVKEVIKRCIKAKDNAVSDSISKYNGEDAIRTNGFVKIKEDGDWTSYKYNGSDFDGAVFKIHQYNPSLIAFVSNGNRTITVRNKYLNDSDDTAQGEIEVLKSFGFDYKDGKWVKESNNNNIIVQPDYHYVSVIGPGDTEKHCKKYQYQSAGMLKKIIASNIKDSSIKDVSYVSGKNLKIGQKIVEDGEVLEVVDIKETQRGVNNNYRDVTLKNVKTGATETVHFGNSALARLNDYSIKDTKFLVHAYNDGKLLEEKLVNTKVEAEQLAKEFTKKYGEYSTSIKLVYSDITDADPVKAGKDPKQAAAIAYSVQRENDSSIKDVDWDFANKLKQHSQEEIRNALKYSAPTVYKQYRNGETIQFAGLAGQLTGPEKTKVLKRLGDSYMKDADPVKVEKIIRREKSALGITYYLFQTKSDSGATIYYEVTDKSYHGEPTYSGGGIISFSLQSANDSLDSHLLYDKLVSKYGKMAGRKRFFLGKNDSVQRENDASTGYKYRITNNGSKWYYETTFPDGHTTLTGPYSSKQETEQYFHKHRPTEKLTDADPVKVEKIIRKEKSALGITYYIFQTKSSSGYTIYYQVTDRTYHGEPTYSGGGIISLSLKSANDTLDHNLLSDKLKAKYGEKEGTKRYLRGENDSAIKDKLSTSDANSLVEAYIDKYKYTHSNLLYVNKPKIKIFNSPEEFRDKFLSSYRGYSIFAGGLLNYNGYVVKLFTSAKDGKIESPSADNIFTIFPTTSIKDSNNIKNRKSYTIKVGDKQYKVFAESESEAINKYLKSKKQ